MLLTLLATLFECVPRRSIRGRSIMAGRRRCDRLIPPHQALGIVVVKLATRLVSSRPPAWCHLSNDGSWVLSH